MRAQASLALLLVASAVPLSPAQVVHPAIYAASPGVTNNAFPFAFAGGGVYQQTYEAAQFSGPIAVAQLGFRYQNDNVRSGGSLDCRITLSYAAVPWNAPTSVFASNVGANPVVVFDGIATVPPFQGDPANPNPFTFLIGLTTPFAYDPAQGDLLMEVLVRTSGSSSWASFERAAGDVGTYRIYASGNQSATSGTVSNVGLITLFDGPQCAGRYVSRGAGCNDSTRTPLVLRASGCPDRGTVFGLTVETGANNTAPVLLMMGLSDQNWLGIQLPLDLGLFGAQGCSLYVSQEALLGPIANPGGGAGIQAPIPNDPLLTRGTTYWQGLIIDPAANSFGLVTTNMLAVTIG